jgi:O-antigen ligase
MVEGTAHDEAAGRNPGTDGGVIASLFHPRLVISSVVCLGVLAALGVDFAVGPLALIGLLCGMAAVAGIATFPGRVLLAVVMLRPVLSVLPELDIAGRQIGVDGILNLLVLTGFVLALPVRRPWPVSRPHVWVAGAFLAVTFISLRQSVDALFGFRQWLRFFGYLVFFWTAYTAAAREPEFPRRLARVIVTVALILLAMGAAQMALLLGQMSFGEYVRMMLEPGLTHRLDGFQNVPHIYGNMLMVCTLVVLCAARDAQTKQGRAAHVALAGLCMMAMVYTGVRSVIIALAVALAVLLVGTGRWRLLAVFSALFLCVGFGSGVFQARMSEFVDPSRASEWNSLRDRQEIWSVVDLGIARRPIGGHGLGSVNTYVGASPLRHGTVQHSTHCDYRKFAFAAGIPGGVLFALMWLSLVATAWWRRRLGVGAGHLTAVAAIGIGFMTIALVDEIMQDYASMTMLWTFAGAALGLGHSARTGGRTEEDTPESVGPAASEDVAGSPR